MDKSSLTETEIRSRYITPAITEAGWDLHTQIREELVITAGRIIVRGQMNRRAKGVRADYVLYRKPNIPIAIVEAKDNKHSVGDGMQQALRYAELMDVPFAFSSNGDGFMEHDAAGTGPVEKSIAMDAFPSPQDLWSRFRQWKGLTDETEAIVTQDYHTDATGKSPRYYQLVAINRTIEAIAKGQDRILLVMATGTGKTFTAFQIIWRLWKAGVKKRILFLADRNILVDQTKTNDFKPFGQAMTKIKNRKVDKSYEIYLSLYQAISGTEEAQNIYREFSPDFFDLIVIDECHRGSAAEDATWKEILQYFSSATQIGLTATPKETKYVSNIHYFGTPIFTYSLKQGIEDGFLAPYKVVRIDIDKDLSGWRPEKGKHDDRGQEIEDRIYNQRDFDRQLVLTKRTELVAKQVSEFLKGTDRFDKTIVFCEDIDHAERMRTALVNENADLAADNRKYIMRITGDNDEGKAELDNFIDPESRYPVITTTSQLMSTGVDAQTCKLIVLDKRIQSMTEFKQIIGRGTRINEDYGKFFFTIMDFKKATELFADPDFDGDPVQVYTPGPGESPVPPDEPTDTPPGSPEPSDDISDPPPGGDGPGKPRKKYYVGDVEVCVVAERIQYYDKDGKLVTESLREFSRKAVRAEYASLDDFLTAWTKAERKAVIIEELESEGVIFEELAKQVGKDLDPFDIVSHIAYDQPPLTRRERADNVRKRNYFTKYGDQARKVMEALLEKYANQGIRSIETMKVLQVQPLSGLGTPVELVEAFGGKDEYLSAVRDLETQIYTAA